jgi:hypothetical protein
MRKKKLCVALCCLSWAACADDGIDLGMHERTLPARVEPELQAAPTRLIDNSDLFYVLDPRTGRIVSEIPPVVLHDIFAQLKRRGMMREAEHVQRLYDLGSGRVRDRGPLARAEERIRSLNRNQEVRHDAQD